jgi:glycosyltransferase involved in cell wall biosynthesis
MDIFRRKVKMRVLFIIPCYNASRNIENIAKSLMSQSSDEWDAILIDDISNDNTYDVASRLREDKFTVIKNEEKKYALRNIVEAARKFEDMEDIIIAVIDGDDYLCNENTVSLLIDSYNDGNEVVWTAHRWDINNLNISKEMPQNVDPYSWPWCSSHLRTFKASLLRNISDINFKDPSGKWFERGYDQALMLPLLKVSRSRKYIDEICYVYNINSVSMPYRDYEEMSQISTINIVRSRGLLIE